MGPNNFCNQNFRDPFFFRYLIFWNSNFSDIRIFFATTNLLGAKRTPTNFTLKKGSIGLYFKEGERVGVLMVSDRCLEVGWKVSDRCLKGVLKVTSLSPAQFGTNFYLELEFDSGVNLTCLYFFFNPSLS